MDLFVGRREEFVGGNRDQFTAEGKAQEVLGFSNRPSSDANELEEFLSMGARTPFDEIGRNGQRRSSQLVREVKQVSSRKGVSQIKDLMCQPVRFLPDLQL